MRSACFAAVAVLLMFTHPGTLPYAFAWENDVHYGLTRWLAVQVGYGDEFAKELAQGNADVDEGLYDARKLVLWYACLSFQTSGFETARDHHFPTEAAKPGPPKDRTVIPDSPYAQREAEAQINRSTPTDDQRRDSVRRFGKGLHALQDSWSHQGEPGIPPVCHADYAWGHPSERGDWYRHRADLTGHWPKDTLATAHATWRVLVAYAKAKPWVVVRKPPRAWPELVADVEAFSAARTKTDKAQWFRTHGFDNVAFLAHLSLRDGSESLSRIAQSGTAVKQPPQTLAGVPDDAAQFLREFWNLWVSTRDFRVLTQKYVAADKVVEKLKIAGASKISPAVAEEIAANALALWRIADHGQVEELGHVPPVPGTKAASELTALLKDPAAVIVSEVPYAMLAIGKNGPPLVIAPVPGTNTYAAHGRFRHAPDDVVRVVAERVDGRWKIVEILSVVDH